MGIFTAKYENRIAQLEREIDSLRNELSGEKTVAKYDREQYEKRISQLMNVRGGSPIMNDLIFRALRNLDTYKLKAYIYFQDELSRLEPMKIMRIKLYKQNSKNVPHGWQIEKGGVIAIDENGEMIGKIPPEDVAKFDIKTSRHYSGYVLPPFEDQTNGIRYCDHFEPYIFLNGVPM